MLLNRYVIFAYQLLVAAVIDPVMFPSRTGLPQDVRSASAGGLQGKC